MTCWEVLTWGVKFLHEHGRNFNMSGWNFLAKSRGVEDFPLDMISKMACMTKSGAWKNTMFEISEVDIKQKSAWDACHEVTELSLWSLYSEKNKD